VHSGSFAPACRRQARISLVEYCLNLDLADLSDKKERSEI